MEEGIAIDSRSLIHFSACGTCGMSCMIKRGIGYVFFLVILLVLKMNTCSGCKRDMSGIDHGVREQLH